MLEAQKALLRRGLTWATAMNPKARPLSLSETRRDHGPNTSRPVGLRRPADPTGKGQDGRIRRDPTSGKSSFRLGGRGRSRARNRTRLRTAARVRGRSRSSRSLRASTATRRRRANSASRSKDTFRNLLLRRTLNIRLRMTQRLLRLMLRRNTPLPLLMKAHHIACHRNDVIGNIQAKISAGRLRA